MRKTYFFGLIMVFMLTWTANCHATATSEVSPEAALKMLEQGNQRFVSGKTGHPNQTAKRRVETADKGQNPFAVVLSCADSRVPVEVLFDRGIGDIFVIRVAGNIASKTDIGSMEYAVDHLGSPLLVILGHSKCGVVTATMQGGEVPPNIKAIVDCIEPAVGKAKTTCPDKSGEALLQEAITANVWQAIADIYKNSPLINEKVKGGKLKVVGAVYDLKNGKINWMGPHPQQAQLIAGEPK